MHHPKRLISRRVSVGRLIPPRGFPVRSCTFLNPVQRHPERGENH